MKGSPILRKRLGQHHLTRPEICEPLLRFLACEGGWVLEVGAGGGVLTARLLAEAERVTAWELDPAWAFVLRTRLSSSRLRIVAGDALTIPWERLPPDTFAAGNLPYGIATRLIEEMLDGDRFRRAAFLVQLEVARRLAARPGERDFGSLSVLTQARASVELLGRVAPGAFRPPPRVTSAFVGFAPLPRPAVARNEWAAFRSLVRQAFAERRKTLRNNLVKAWGAAEAQRVLRACGLGRLVRAEEIGLGDFLRLHEVRKLDNIVG